MLAFRCSTRGGIASYKWSRSEWVWMDRRPRCYVDSMSGKSEATMYERTMFRQPTDGERAKRCNHTASNMPWQKVLLGLAFGSEQKPLPVRKDDSGLVVIADVPRLCSQSKNGAVGRPYAPLWWGHECP